MYINYILEYPYEKFGYIPTIYTFILSHFQLVYTNQKLQKYNIVPKK